MIRGASFKVKEAEKVRERSRGKGFVVLSPPSPLPSPWPVRGCMTAHAMSWRVPLMSTRQGLSGEDNEEMVALREELVECFRERIQIQSSLIELQSQNVHNTAEITKRWVDPPTAAACCAIPKSRVGAYARGTCVQLLFIFAACQGTGDCEV